MVFRMVPLSQFYDSKPFCDSNPIAYKPLIVKQLTTAELGYCFFRAASLGRSL